MFTISYTLHKETVIEDGQVNEEMLRYNFFQGSVILQNDTSKMVFDWNWIPLLDFSFCLLDISNSLAKKEKAEEEFEFTESNDTIRFRREGELINVTTSYFDEALSINFKDFQKEVARFYKDIIFDILIKNPALKENLIFARYLEKV
jgi:hypothetical protein